MISKLDLGATYLIISRVRYDDDTYKMVGKSFGFKYDSNNDFNCLEDNHTQGIAKLIYEYQFSNENIVNIYVIFRKVDAKFLSDIMLYPTKQDKKSLPIFKKNY